MWFSADKTTPNIAIRIEPVINQVYPLNTSYMFSEAGDTNIVVLSAAPTEEICETDEILKFVNVNSVTDWTNSTHITLNNKNLTEEYYYNNVSILNQHDK